jgi:hypothetical protein
VPSNTASNRTAPHDLPAAPGAQSLTQFAIDYPTLILGLGAVLLAFAVTEVIAIGLAGLGSLNVVIPGGLGLAVLTFWWRGYRITRRLRDGSPITGTITGILRRHSSRAPATYLVAYRYRAAGRDLTGYRNFARYADAARWRIGDRADLRVDPADPALSQLQDPPR